MPYCNHCGRYIGGGMFCTRCGDVPQNTEEESGTVGDMPTPDAPVAEGTNEEEESREMPDDMGATPLEEEEDAPAGDVVAGDHVEGDVTGEVVSEGRTIVTLPEEDEDTPPTEEARGTECEGDDTVRPGTESGTSPARKPSIGERIRGWWASIFSPKNGEASFSMHEMRRYRAMAVMCYLGILWAIPYFFCHSSRYVSYHLSHGLHLLLFGCLGLTLGAVALCLSVVAPFMMPLLAGVAEVVLLLAFMVSAWCIIRVLVFQRGVMGNA